MATVTPEDVSQLTRPTDGNFFEDFFDIKFTKSFSFNKIKGFLCPLSANVFGIDFLQFTISDYESKKIIFEVGRDSPTTDMSVDFSSLGEDMYRKIKYEFSEDVLRLPFIETS